VTTSATRTPDVAATNTTSASAAHSAIDSVDRERPSSRRESVLATALVGLVAAVVLFGLAFPELLAPAVAIAVLAAIVALDTLLPSAELRQMRENHWTF
jgi:protein-S-isoprenylcysteine O-methyltransferase Ste14